LTFQAIFGIKEERCAEAHQDLPEGKKFVFSNQAKVMWYLQQQLQDKRTTTDARSMFAAK